MAEIFKLQGFRLPKRGTDPEELHNFIDILVNLIEEVEKADLEQDLAENKDFQDEQDPAD